MDLPASAEDDFVCLDATISAYQGHVDERLRVQQLLERSLYMGKMVVPS